MPSAAAIRRMNTQFGRRVLIILPKNAPPLGSHVFHAKVTIFEHIGTNLLTKLHEDRKIIVALDHITKKCPAPWRPYIIGINLLTKFHEDQRINVASRVLTRFYYIFQANLTIFELIQDII
ncbi:hypothetical protein DPMN_018613 [Dreissena polymorpha]|uniref:Uncharacterized protein n=1 Tax=Dreissena polymorpha TaxID=45954 RepID=A0A9D4NGW0_DREPO|nr:hypothetical protein DPMN_018613 [Dreissena polymorpha]